jgi:predicted amidohydrolase
VRPRRIPVASIQTPAHDRSAFESAWPRILASVDEAAQGGAKLIVLPEGTVPGYVLGTEPVSSDLLDDARAAIAVSARRYEATIVYGTALHAGRETYNAAVVIGPDGTQLGSASKRFLWHFDRRWFARGTELEPLETPVGKLGLLVCADGRIPSIAATLVERGAEILVMPTAWVTSGRDPANRENVQADLMVNVRARENGVPFVAANKAGVELASVAYCGKSALVDADGAFVARAGETDAQIISGTLELGGSARASRHTFVPATAQAARQRPAAARIAFTPATDALEIQRLRELAAIADADGMLDATHAAHPEREVEIAGVRAAVVGWETLRSARGLVAARLAGIDLFICGPAPGEPEWLVPFARTRAMELRAYVVAFADAHRAFAVDPDGVVVAGTFDGFRMAAFAYDAARAAATRVAPATDVLAGLRDAEAIRSREPGAELVV